MQIETVKRIVTMFIGALSSWLGILATPVYILALLGVLDYFTGIAAAPHRGEERSPYKGFQGIVKKVCLLVLVALAAIVDWVLMFASEYLGIAMPLTFMIASLTAMWLICNEIISILGNIGDLGVQLPPFLGKAVAWVKQAVEEKGAEKQ